MLAIEARDTYERIHALLGVYANPIANEFRRPYLRELGVETEVGQTVAAEDMEKIVDRLIALEDTAVEMLSGDLSDFAIIRSDGKGKADDPKDIEFNSYNRVESIQVTPKQIVVEWPDGHLSKEIVNRYEAIGFEYTADDGRVVRDTTVSAPEGWVIDDGVIKFYGGASALVARLLEVKAAGLI